MQPVMLVPQLSQCGLYSLSPKKGGSYHLLICVKIKPCKRKKLFEKLEYFGHCGEILGIEVAFLYTKKWLASTRT